MSAKKQQLQPHLQPHCLVWCSFHSVCFHKVAGTAGSERRDLLHQQICIASIPACRLGSPEAERVERPTCNCLWTVCAWALTTAASSVFIATATCLGCPGSHSPTVQLGPGTEISSSSPPPHHYKSLCLAAAAWTDCKLGPALAAINIGQTWSSNFPPLSPANKLVGGRLCPAISDPVTFTVAPDTILHVRAAVACFLLYQSVICVFSVKASFLTDLN